MLETRKLMIPVLIAIFLFPFLPVNTAEGIQYRRPSEEIEKLAKAPRTPSIDISPDGKHALLLKIPNFKKLEDIAGRELRIGGLRINPATNGPSRSTYYKSIDLLSLPEGEEIAIEGIPENSKISNLSWSPDGKKVAMLLTQKNGIELRVLDIEERRVKKLTTPVLNDAYYGYPYRWMPGSERIIFKSVVKGRGEPPEKPEVPEGPVIQENKGTKAPVRTYQDLIDNSYEEELFQYYMTSELKIVDLNGDIRRTVDSSMVIDFETSPDGKYILVQSIEKPFSYIVPAYRFPRTVKIMNIRGEMVRKIADIPMAEDIPKGFDAVREGPRDFHWRSNVPATLYWVEAMDGGNPASEVEVRDRLYYLESPFTGEPEPSIPFNLRFSGITWGRENLAIAHEHWWNSRREITSFFDPENPEEGKEVIFDRSWENRYDDPGDFLTTTSNKGKQILLMDKEEKHLYLSGTGASPEGNRPFIDRFEIKTGETERLWRSSAPYYEIPIRILDPQRGLLLTRRESKKDPPDYYIRNLKKEKIESLTDLPHPYPHLSETEVKMIRYERDDGIKLTAKLYLPPGYTKDDGRLPVLMWAYPIEYRSADAASQVRDSPYRFMRIGWWSPQVFLTKGYAILSNASMPVIAKGDREPNDTYISQLVANARAAVNKITDMGVADRGRVAIGGHSYGAFMAANLLAHSDLFAAGIARSGAYNRTLTPFGFQREQRTLWEAMDVYIKMSPFMSADSVNDPLLLIHGEADNNSGTYPLQSRRFYHALKGHGATVRLVMLPHESHWYRAEKSIMHQLWEMENWLEKYVKPENIDK